MLPEAPIRVVTGTKLEFTWLNPVVSPPRVLRWCSSPVCGALGDDVCVCIPMMVHFELA